MEGTESRHQVLSVMEERQNAQLNDLKLFIYEYLVSVRGKDFSEKKKKGRESRGKRQPTTESGGRRAPYPQRKDGACCAAVHPPTSTPAPLMFTVSLAKWPG